MKIISQSVLFLLALILFSSCVTSAYITDQESIERQKEMRKYRTGVNFAEVGIIFASAVGEAFTGVNVYPEPSQQSFRKMVLVSESKDTLFINMVTDWLWKDSTYCDIREIVMPPLKTAKVIVPMGVAYNIFFRTDYNAPDDEKVEINTAETTRVKLNPTKIISEEKATN
ncbi:MAG TPA: hypothetical protein VGK38_05725 [Prolixibacteraceae bacterium]|jgi:hypothetical protein